LKYKTFSKFHHLPFAFGFFSIFDIFFFLFYLYIVVKKFLKFVWFYCIDVRFYQRTLQNYGFFFSKNFRYSKSKISPKLHRLLFLFFLAFLTSFFFLFHLSKLVKKIWNFCSVLVEGLEILSTNSINF